MKILQKDGEGKTRRDVAVLMKGVSALQERENNPPKRREKCKDHGNNLSNFVD